MCSIKCGLKEHFNKDHAHKDQIIEQVKKNAIMCTKIARLASLLIHYVFNTIMDKSDEEINEYFDVFDDNRDKNSPTEQKIKDFFYAVLGPYNHSSEYPMHIYRPRFS